LEVATAQRSTARPESHARHQIATQGAPHEPRRIDDEQRARNAKHAADVLSAIAEDVSGGRDQVPTVASDPPSLSTECVRA
jgi:hypothetical protein